MKAISTVTFGLLLLIILVTLLLPIALILFSTPTFSQQGSKSSEAYKSLKDLQVDEVFKGEPNIYYNSTKNPSLVFSYSSIPKPFPISYIYYFNSTMWVVAYSNITVSSSLTLKLPQIAFNKPIIIVTSLGNVFYIAPNSSVTSQAISPSKGLVYVIITSFAVNGSQIYPVSVSINFNNKVYQTPVVISILPGTYSLTLNNLTVFLPQYSLTGFFTKWTLVGQGLINPNNQPTTTLTIAGPLVVTAIYNLSTVKYPVKIKAVVNSVSSCPSLPTNLPLSSSIKDCNLNTATLTSVNSTITIIIDGKVYNIGGQGITLNLTNGYHSIGFPSQVNIYFNYNTKNYYVPYGALYIYIFNNYVSNQNITIGYPNQNYTLIFVKGEGYINASYSLDSIWYRVEFRNNFQLPSGYKLISNSSPVLGNIAGQLIEINNNQLFGPLKDYTPQVVYMKSGSYKITHIYLRGIYGEFVLKKGSNTITYSQLISNPQGLNVINATKNTNINVGNNIYIYSPTTVIDNQQWTYGGIVLSAFLFRAKKNPLRAISSTVSFIIIIMIVLIVFLPLLLYIENMNQYSQVIGASVSNYISIRNNIYKAVDLGHPAIYYDGGKAQLIFTHSNGTFVPPINLTINGILYFTGNSWANLTTFLYPIKIYNNTALKLPDYVKGKPVILVTNYGNLFLLYPNQSIGPISPSQKGGFLITALITKANNVYQAYANITTNATATFKAYRVPVVFPNFTGTYVVNAPLYTYYLYPNGSVLTGKLYNWYVIGNALLNPINSTAVKITLTGQSVTLVANYSPLFVFINSQILTNSNTNINVNVNGKTFSLSSTSPASTTIPAGFVNITVITMAANDTSSMSNGVITQYSFLNLQIKVNFKNGSVITNTYTSPSVLVFISPDATSVIINVNYFISAKWYKIYIDHKYIGWPNNATFSYDPGDPVNQGNLYFILNSTGYYYGQSYWIKAGSYAWGAINLIKGYNNYIEINGNSQYFQYVSSSNPYIDYNSVRFYPGQLITINSPGTIIVYYWWFYGDTQL
jgi:hypothetical protein